MSEIENKNYKEWLNKINKLLTRWQSKKKRENTDYQYGMKWDIITHPPSQKDKREYYK